MSKARNEQKELIQSPGSASFPLSYLFLKNKILWYKKASDEDVRRCVTDRPYCGFAAFHQAIDMPLAIREARRRGILPNDGGQS
jgi:hypothetical protein